MKGRVNLCGKLYCCLLSRNCHSHPAFSNHHQDQSWAIKAKSFTGKKKNYNSLKAHMMVSICLNQTIFKVCLFFDIVLLYTKDYSINIILYILRRKKKVLRLKILTLLQWSGTEPTIPPRFACIYLSCRCMHAQSYLTLCDPMNCSPPGSSVHGILQARILEWVAIPLSGVSSWPRDQTHIWQVDSLPLSHLGSLIIAHIYFVSSIHHLNT